MTPTSRPPHLSRRHLIAALAGTAALPSWAQSPAAWPAIESRARGQTVYFNAWAGSERINSYLQWTAEQVRRQYGVRLEHVKITETAEVVKRVRSEKAAGKADGSVDLVWINGENFLTMKREGLLFGPFAEALPNYQYVDVAGKPTTRIDFSEPVDGMEAPWGMAQLTFFADRKRVPKAPRSMSELLAFARANPGRLTYPRLPDFHGTSFVKQALVEALADHNAHEKTPGRSQVFSHPLGGPGEARVGGHDKKTPGRSQVFSQPLVGAGDARVEDALYKPVTQQALASAGAPLWAFLDALHPHLWRSGRHFPNNAAAVRQMMADGELLIALTFNPNEAANEIAAGRLPASVTSYQHSGGTIGNTHFLAIAFNSRAREGAQVVANFLLSPLAQARKADLTLWGDPSVLALDKLPPGERARFSAATLPGQVEQTMPAIAEPHGSWVDPLEKEWLRRYG